MITRHFKTAFSNLYSAKQRTLLALVGIIIGIASVIAMLSVGLISSKETMRQYQDLGSDLLTITKKDEEEEETDDEEQEGLKKRNLQFYRWISSCYCLNTLKKLMR